MVNIYISVVLNIFFLNICPIIYMVSSSFLFILFFAVFVYGLEVYHGINGNVSLDRRGELVTSPPSRYDLTLGSDKSGSLTRSEAGGIYDISQAEAVANRASANGINNNHSASGTSSNNGTLDSSDGEARKRVSNSKSNLNTFILTSV